MIETNQVPNHLSDLVEPPVGASDFKLWSDLKLLLLLLEVHQVPLVLEPGLAPLPELQKQSHCVEETKQRDVKYTIAVRILSPAFVCLGRVFYGFNQVVAFAPSV